MAQQTIPSQAVLPKDSPTIDHRTWVRMPNDYWLSCQPMAASTRDELDTGWLGRVRDVSPGGIGLLLNHRFEPGTGLIIELLAMSKILSRPRSVRVVHATPEKEGHWIIGCVFAWPLTQQELQIFLRE